MAICHPDNAIWPDPSVILPPEDASPEAVALLEQQVSIALGLAWSTLQVLSAYSLAICPAVVRPSSERCAWGSYFIAPVEGPMLSSFWPTVRNGQWYNLVCSDHDGFCDCSTVRHVALPSPVGGIVEVNIDGVVLPASAYRVDDGFRLVRQDGEGWPLTQDFSKPAGEVGTFTVTFYQGAVEDVTVRYAAGVLASEYLLAILGQDCRLPAGTTQIVRQGITYEVQADFFQQGMTGLPEVDAVIQRFNPYGLRTPPKIFSLDRRPARRTTIGG